MNKILIIGLGSVGKGLLPLLRWKFPDVEINILTADPVEYDIVTEFNVYSLCTIPVTKENYEYQLGEFRLAAGDLLINAAVGVSSMDLIKWCDKNKVLYVDACIEPWEGGYESENVLETTNTFLRRQLIDSTMRCETTALIGMGANPGLVSAFVSEALTIMAEDHGIDPLASDAYKACMLGVKVIQISEEDTQSPYTQHPKQFTNTWSVDGLLTELKQRSEIGYGSHEPKNVAGITRIDGEVSAYLDTIGAATKAYTWIPFKGKMDGFVLTHNESISIAESLSIRHNGYSPTVFYCYNPAPYTTQAIHEWSHSGYPEIKKEQKHVFSSDEIWIGSDTLGVLLMTDNYSFWYGSRLENIVAENHFPYNNATTLQVTATILSGIEWMLRNPKEGVCEAHTIPSKELLSGIRPFLGDMIQSYTKWAPEGDLTFETFRVKK